MNGLTDQQLLHDYAASRSEPAFAELVRRHVDFVYSAALRMVRDRQLAEDVTQSVFLALAQNALQLVKHPVLPGWLHRTTRNLAANVVRSEMRRCAREQEAATMNQLLSPESDASWERIAPQLDAALDELNETDRDTLLLRYFHRKSANEIGRVFGISEEAAQRRVSRAVDRLRDSFAKQGVGISAGGLAVVVSANAVQAAPVGLAASITTATALAGATAVSATTTASVTKAIAMTSLQKTIIAATLTVGVGTGIFGAHQSSRLRAENQALQQYQAPLTTQIQQLERELDEASNRVVALKEEIGQSSSNSAELLRLRGEVARLRRDSQELAALKANGAASKSFDAAFADKYPGPRWKGFLEDQAREGLERLKEIANLTPDQEQAAKALLLKRAGLIDQQMQDDFGGEQTPEQKDQARQAISDLDAQVEALLSPDQSKALKAAQHRSQEAFARLSADSELVTMQSSVGISRDQEDQLFPILYDLALKERDGGQVDPNEKPNAVKGILTPRQAEKYRKFLEDKTVRAVVQVGAK